MRGDQGRCLISRSDHKGDSLLIIIQNTTYIGYFLSRAGVAGVMVEIVSSENFFPFNDTRIHVCHDLFVFKDNEALI